MRMILGGGGDYYKYMMHDVLIVIKIVINDHSTIKSMPSLMLQYAVERARNIELPCLGRLFRWRMLWTSKPSCAGYS